MVTALICLAQANRVVDFPNQEMAYDPAGAASYELAIVRYDKRIGIEERSFEVEKKPHKVRVAIDRVQVLDSTLKLEKSSLIVTPISGEWPALQASPTTDLRKLQSGKTYLLVTAKPSATALRMPLLAYLKDFPTDKDEDRWASITPIKRPEEAIGLAAIETKATKLVTNGLPPIDRLMVNVASCLNKGNTDAVKQACTFLAFVRYGWWRYVSRQPASIRMAKVPDNAPFLPVMAGAYVEQSPPNAARIAMILFDWQSKDGGVLLYSALKKAIDDPLLFYQAGDYSVNGLLGPEAVFGSASTAEERERKIGKLFDLAFAAKSSTVKWLVIDNWGHKPDVARQRRALAMAESSADDFARVIFNHIAAWHGDEENLPKFEKKGSNLVFVNRAELSRYWRGILGI